MPCDRRSASRWTRGFIRRRREAEDREAIDVTIARRRGDAERRRRRPSPRLTRLRVTISPDAAPSSSFRRPGESRGPSCRRRDGGEMDPGFRRDDEKLGVTKRKIAGASYARKTRAAPVPVY